jgi:hypothetical protein
MFGEIGPLILRDSARGANIVDEISVTGAKLDDTAVCRYLPLKVVRHEGAPQNLSPWVVSETRLEIAVAQ